MPASIVRTFVCVFMISSSPSHAVIIDMVTVGNPGNASDNRYGDNLGKVDYVYQIGKYEVTAGQYTEFLNAVAANDTYRLYNTSMLEIQRTAVAGAYKYSTAPEWADRPVSMVSWAAAARFVNWLSNGQPHGSQNLSTTEDGSYYLNGATGDIDEYEFANVVRKPNATYVLPTDDEWYKAAYYDPNMPDGPGYWDYATRSNSKPSNVLSATGTNNANVAVISGFDRFYTIGSPYYRTKVGAFANSVSAYGTYDQTGNVWEWVETPISIINRASRGGSYTNSAESARSSKGGGRLGHPHSASVSASPWFPSRQVLLYLSSADCC